MNKRFQALLSAAILFCYTVLSGCSPTQKEPDLTNDTSKSVTTNNIISLTAPETETDADAADESAELTYLRSKIKESGCGVGIAFIDYVEDELSEDNTAIYLNQSELAEKYPCLKNIKTVAIDGINLFVLVPATEKGVITVFPTYITDSGELEVNKDEVIYESLPGEPIALKCNMSESYSNVLVSVANESETCEFYPMISLEDGWSVALQDGCYDFSIDDIRKYVDDAYFMMPQTYPEIEEALADGKELIYAGQFYFCNQIMIRFELGGYGVNGDFVCEKQYAVSFDATYAMDPADHNWYVIGAGVTGMGLKK